jgi:hypothetical protein
MRMSTRRFPGVFTSRTTSPHSWNPISTQERSKRLVNTAGAGVATNGDVHRSPGRPVHCLPARLLPAAVYNHGGMV